MGGGVPPRKNPLSSVANNNKCLKKALSLKLPTDGSCVDLWFDTITIPETGMGQK